MGSYSSGDSDVICGGAPQNPFSLSITKGGGRQKRKPEGEVKFLPFLRAHFPVLSFKEKLGGSFVMSPPPKKELNQNMMDNSNDLGAYFDMDSRKASSSSKGITFHMFLRHR